MMREAQGLVLAPSLEAFFQALILEPDVRIKAVGVDRVFECARAPSYAARQARQEVFGDMGKDAVDDLVCFSGAGSVRRGSIVEKLEKPKVVRVEKSDDVSDIERAAVEKVSAKLNMWCFHRGKVRK